MLFLCDEDDADADDDDDGRDGHGHGTGQHAAAHEALNKRFQAPSRFCRLAQVLGMHVG